LAAKTGGKSWIRLGPLGTIQPSELVKIPFIMILAKVVTKHNSQYPDRDYQSDFWLIGKLGFFALIPLLLVLRQNDLGTALVYIAIIVGIVLLSGIKWQILLPVFLTVLIVGGGLIYLS